MLLDGATDMKIVGCIIRIVGASTSVLPVVMPSIWYYQLLGGVLYGFTVPFFLGLPEYSQAFMDILEQASAPVSNRKLVLQGACIIAMWLTVWLLWPAFVVYLLRMNLALWFVLGSVVGSIFAFLATSWVSAARGR